MWFIPLFKVQLRHERILPRVNPTDMNIDCFPASTLVPGSPVPEHDYAGRAGIFSHMSMA